VAAGVRALIHINRARVTASIMIRASVSFIVLRGEKHMAIRYLRRPPKPAAAKARAAHRVEVTPEEQAAMAQSLAYFCAACGREHSSPDVHPDDVCCAEARIKAVIRETQS
jgi:hypothetical protein